MSDTNSITKGNSTSRIAWLDWMKTIAMFLIIAGHNSVPGGKYLYVFSVPCFFIISGFLSKRELNNSTFWIKLWWNLTLPLILYTCFIMLYHFIGAYFGGRFEWKFLYESPFLAMCGFQGLGHPSGGLLRMWFVYTLIICKIILQYTPKSHEKILLLVLNLFFLIGCIFLIQNDYYEANAIVNVLLAMPFFTIGYFFKTFKEKLNHMSLYSLLVLGTVSLIITGLCGYFNDPVMLYRCSYGSNLLLCILGGVFGTVIVFVLSFLSKSYLSYFVRVVGGGTLVILAFHYEILKVVNRFLNINGLWRYLEALIILLAFFPIIMFIKNNLPVLYGKYRAK